MMLNASVFKYVGLATSKIQTDERDIKIKAFDKKLAERHFEKFSGLTFPQSALISSLLPSRFFLKAINFY
jgi:hypothetical protein